MVQSSKTSTKHMTLTDNSIGGRGNVKLAGLLCMRYLTALVAHQETLAHHEMCIMQRKVSNKNKWALMHQFLEHTSTKVHFSFHSTGHAAVDLNLVQQDQN